MCKIKTCMHANCMRGFSNFFYVEILAGIIIYSPKKYKCRFICMFIDSSNNIFNKGKYKFAFVLLHELVPGDTFYITKDGKVYAYEVFNKMVVEPGAVEVLNPVEGHQAIATLITCDPPGTSLKRLVIQGDQVSPSPSGNTAAADNSSVASATAEQLTEPAAPHPNRWRAKKASSGAAHSWASTPPRTSGR